MDLSCKDEPYEDQGTSDWHLMIIALPVSQAQGKSQNRLKAILSAYTSVYRGY